MLSAQTRAGDYHVASCERFGRIWLRFALQDLCRSWNVQAAERLQKAVCRVSRPAQLAGACVRIRCPIISEHDVICDTRCDCDFKPVSASTHLAEPAFSPLLPTSKWINRTDEDQPALGASDVSTRLTNSNLPSAYRGAAFSSARQSGSVS